MNLPSAAVSEHGIPVVRYEKKYFQVVNMASTKSRPKLMPTIASYHDPVIVKQLALSIQEASVSPTVVPEEGVVVYEDANPRWVSWEDLGPWNAVYSSLNHFLETRGVPGHSGSIDVSSPQLTRPVHPVTDFRCPTLTILLELHGRGFRPVTGTVVHKENAIGDMDGREAIRMKAYFIVLLQLDRCLPLTSNIPSDQPILFHKLLLNCQRAEPGLGEAGYLAISRGGGPPLAITDEVSSIYENRSTKTNVVMMMILQFIVPMFFSRRCYHDVMS